MAIFVLCHADKQVVAKGLQHIREIWEAWEAAERASHVNDEVAEVLHNIVWMTHQWPRLVCLELLESDWQEVPAELAKELMETARGPHTTNVTEDVIAEPRKNKRGWSPTRNARD